MTTMRASCWSVTINNPTAVDEEEIALARQKGWSVEGQLEKGEEGTPHYQLMVKTPQVRFSSVKKAFSRAHIEVARDQSALRKYVHKDQTREGDLPSTQEMYPSLSKFWELVTDHYNSGDSDGLDQTYLPDRVVFYSEETERLFKQTPLVFLDEATRALIRRGYVVEGIACNPSTRSAWKMYGRELMYRSLNSQNHVEIQSVSANSDGQDTPPPMETARQTDSVKMVQEVMLPTIITNAQVCPPPPPCPFWKGEGPWSAHACSACTPSRR